MLALASILLATVRRGAAPRTGFETGLALAAALAMTLVVPAAALAEPHEPDGRMDAPPLLDESQLLSGPGTKAPARRGLANIRRIVVDPGHGGCNQGALGVAHTHEKHLTLPISLHLADRLRDTYPDVEVVLTRHEDAELGLSERAEIANALDADLFISVHLNAATNPEAVGYETWVVADTSPSLDADRPVWSLATGAIRGPALWAVRLSAAARALAFAEALHASYAVEVADVRDRGIKRADYTVLRKANMPAVVVELGFLSHAEEGLSVVAPAYQARFVDAMVDAVGAWDQAGDVQVLADGR